MLIYGGSLTGDLSEHQTVSLLEAGFRVITYDQRRFGQFGHPESDYDYDTCADDLAAVFEV